MSFRGIPAGNDARYTNAEKKLLQNTKFPAIFQTKVDTTKVNFQVLGTWINKRVTELLGIEDEVVVELVHSLMEERYPDPKKCQITLTGFLEKSAPVFMQEFWEMMISAQDSIGGIPASLLEAKKAELQNRRTMEAQISNSLGKRVDRRGSPPSKSQGVQRQSIDDYERPLRMRETGRHTQSYGRNDVPSVQQRNETARGRGRDISQSDVRNGNNEAGYTNQSSPQGRSSMYSDVIDSRVRPRATHDARRLSPVAHNDRPREQPSDNRDKPSSRTGRDIRVEAKRRRSSSGSPPSTPPRRRRGESVDSIGRRKRPREPRSRSPEPRSRSRDRHRSSHKPRSRSSPRPKSRTRDSARERRPSRRSGDHSPRRHRSRRSARSQASSGERETSRSLERRSRRRGSRERRGRRRSPTSSRRKRSSSVSSSSSSSRSRSRSHRRRRSRDRRRSSTPSRRRNSVSDTPRDASQRSPESKESEAVVIDEEAQHRENVLKAKLLRQKRMAELKKAREESHKSEATKQVEGQVTDDQTGKGAISL